MSSVTGKKTSKYSEHVNGLIFNTDTHSAYDTEFQNLYDNSLDFGTEPFTHFFHHLREDSISYDNPRPEDPICQHLYLQSIGHFICATQYFCERRGVDSYLIIYTKSGEGRLFYQNQEFHLKKGDTLFIDCSQYHKYQTISAEFWDIIFFHFNGTLAEQYYIDSTKNGFQIMNFYTNFDIEAQTMRMYSTLMKNMAYKNILCSNILHTIVTEILLELNYSEMFTAPAYIYAVQKEINNHFGRNVTLDNLAASVNMSKYHLSREFKRYTGDTIQNTLINTRLSYAKNLLLYSDLSIEAITVQCGLQSTSHFIKIFRARFQMTPHQYRKTWNDPS